MFQTITLKKLCAIVKTDPFKSLILTQTFVERLALFVIPIYVFKISQSTTMLGIAVVLEWLPTIIFLPIAGRFVDKLGAFNSIVYACLFRSLCVFLSTAIILFYPEVFFLLFVSLVSSVGNIISYLGFEKHVASFSCKNTVENYYSFFSLNQQLNQIIAPIIGAFLVAKITPLFFFVAYTIVFFITYLQAKKNLKVHVSNINSDKTQDFKVALFDVFNQGGLLKLSSLMFLVNVVVSVLITTTPAVIIGYYNRSDYFVSAFYILSAMVAFMFHKLLMSKRYSFFIRKIGSLSPILISFFLIPVASERIEIFFICGVTALSLLLPFSVWSRTKRNSLIPQNNFAYTASLVMIISLLGYPVGGVIVASLNKYLSSQEMVATSSLLILPFLIILKSKIK